MYLYIILYIDTYIGWRRGGIKGGASAFFVCVRCIIGALQRRTNQSWVFFSLSLSLSLFFCVSPLGNTQPSNPMRHPPPSPPPLSPPPPGPQRRKKKKNTHTHTHVVLINIKYPGAGRSGATCPLAAGARGGIRHRGANWWIWLSMPAVIAAMNHGWEKGRSRSRSRRRRSRRRRRRRKDEEFTVTTQTITQDTGQEAVNIFVIGSRHPPATCSLQPGKKGERERKRRTRRKRRRRRGTTHTHTHTHSHFFLLLLNKSTDKTGGGKEGNISKRNGRNVEKCKKRSLKDGTFTCAFHCAKNNIDVISYRFSLPPPPPRFLKRRKKTPNSFWNLSRMKYN